MPRGGKRPGAGRKKGYRAPATFLAGQAKEKLVKKVVKKWDELLDTQIRLALGEYYVEEGTDKKGKKVIYKAEPNVRSLQSLTEFVIGKAAQSIDLDAEIETPGIQTGLEKISEAVQNILNTKTTITQQKVEATRELPAKKEEPQKKVEKITVQQQTVVTKPVTPVVTPIMNATPIPQKVLSPQPKPQPVINGVAKINPLEILSKK